MSFWSQVVEFMGKKFNSIIFPQSEKYSNSKVSDKKQEVGKHINYLKE